MRGFLIIVAALALIAVGAMLVFSPGMPSAPHAAPSEGRLTGARDPGRMGWRGPNSVWNRRGTHEAAESLHNVPDGTEQER
jgi:hypothetical protein